MTKVGIGRAFAILFLVAGGLATGVTAAGALSPGAPRHVMVVVMENHEFDQIIGSPAAPFINSLANRYGLATASFGQTHPSLPNYLELASGSTQGISSDCSTCSADAPQVVDQLGAAGIGWRAYMESMPAPCFTGSAYPYDKNHDPFVYAPHIVGNPSECDNVVPYSQLAGDLSSQSAPPFLWVTPNVLDDMHDGSIQQGDAWLSQQLPTVMSSAWYRAGGVIILTWDEGVSSAACCAGAAGGHVATIVISQSAPPGERLGSAVDHAGVLRTIEQLYGLPFLGDAANPVSGGLAGLLSGRTVGGDGGIFAFGDSGFAGSMGGSPLSAPVVGMAPIPDGHGYWEVASDGGVFAFGSAPFMGSMGGTALNSPVVGMAAAPDGHGYWLVAADGGVFAFGSAAFTGSMGGKPLNAPVVGMAPTPDGHGYWEVASDGGVFAFGSAVFTGSMGRTALNAPVAGIAGTPDGNGYWLVATDGGVFAFGTATFFGSMGGKPLNAPIAGMAGAPDGRGYWLVS